MRNHINKVVSIATIGLALIFIAGVVYFHVVDISRNGALAKTAFTTDPAVEDTLFESDGGMVFNSLNEYLEYLAASCDESEAEISYFLPSSVPDDAVLKSIAEYEEGTVFCYDFDRDPVLIPVDSDRSIGNIVEYNVGDVFLTSLLHSSIVKSYSSNLNNVTDRVAFAEALADAIGATIVTDTDTTHIYEGALYADVYNPSNGITTRYHVGTQKVTCIEGSTSVSVTYSYIPIILNELEAESMTTFSEYTLFVNNN